MKNFILAVLVLFFQQFSMYSQSDAAKYLDAIYQEKDVPEYVLPELLTSFNGQKIDSKEVWENVRRPELMKFFGENIYGKVPVPSDPIVTKSEVISEDKSFMEGLCTRREIQITLSNKFGKVSMPLLLFIPNNKEGSYPAIYWINGKDISNNRFDLENPQRYGETRNGAPLKQLMLRGIALISADYETFGDRGKSTHKVLDGNVLDLYFKPGQKNTKKNEWGLMAVWAHAAVTGMDYIVTDTDINPDQVAIMGTSIGGKIALWAAALDQRIGMILSATSGHGGDALWKREVGETLDNMLEWLPRWAVRNAFKYKNKIDKLPVDQHMLLACLAPRPFYVSTAIHDLWADQKGQWLGTYHAAPAYKLYGKKVDFVSVEQPQINKPIVKSHIGFHVRSGFHGLTQYDWERYMEFIEYHFMKIPMRSVHDIYYPNGKLVDHYPNKSR
jgi:pimeloyl-ACP methyl ester carboxylesterase